MPIYTDFLFDADADAVTPSSNTRSLTPGVSAVYTVCITHVGAYHRPSDGHFFYKRYSLLKNTISL